MSRPRVQSLIVFQRMPHEFRQSHEKYFILEIKNGIIQGISPLKIFPRNYIYKSFK